MTDCGFPIINYDAALLPQAWGRFHGESFRGPIRELAAIRTELMREKNPQLRKEQIERLAIEQWAITQDFDSLLTHELQGIAEGADISITDLVVLNNYTDFRDIQVDDQGCSLVYLNVGQGPVAGQTWDMHGSAKNYVCCIDIPEHNGAGRVVAFSLVGCVGMMGFNSRGGMLGVNNLNTDGARPGALWPAIVRKILNQSGQQNMSQCMQSSPKTSGRNFLIAERDQAEMWEVAPGCNERVDRKLPGEQGYLFHTNHCLGPQMLKRETTLSQNSTTHIRYGLLQKKISAVTTFEQLHSLMNDHENYPKSICSNFQSGVQDPSVTCGGAVGHLKTGQVVMWRGDAIYDDNFVSHEFRLLA